MKSTIFFAAIVLAPVLGLANSSGHHTGPAHITDEDIKKIVYQAINVGALFVILFVLLKKHVVEFFSHRGEKFEKAVAASQMARREAEHHNVEIKAKLKKLEDTAASSVVKAKSEAQEMRDSMVEEAKRAAVRIQQESERMAEVEVERAIMHLKENFVDLGIKNSRAFMVNTVGEAEQKKLNQEFIEKIQVQQ